VNLKAPVLVIGVSAALALTGLGDSAFWDDESQVALVAKTAVSTGALSTWDGRNLYTYRNGILTGDDMTMPAVMPPLMFWMTAASFKIFGATTVAGRLPFALAGILSLMVFWSILRTAFAAYRLADVYALSLMAFAVGFLLYIRQCRYYGLAFLFSLATYALYRRALTGKRWSDFLMTGAVAAVFFFSTQLLCLAFLLTLGLSHLVFKRRELDRADWRKLAAGVGLFLAATVPYAVWFKVWVSRDPPLQEVWWERRLRLLWLYLRDLNTVHILPWLVVVLIAVCIHRARKDRPELAKLVVEWTFLAVGNAVFVALLSPQPSAGVLVSDVRYLIISLPFAAGATALSLWWLGGYHRAAPLPAIVLLLVTNVCSLLPGWSSPLNVHRWLLPAFVGELRQKVMTPNEAVATYLSENARQDDLVFAYEEFYNYPLMFYLGDKIRVCCTLDRNAMFPPARAAALGSPAPLEDNFPDWFIVHGLSRGAQSYLQFFSRPHQFGGKQRQIQYKLATRLDVHWAQVQRPELVFHQFETVRNFDRNVEAVYVFRRIQVE
jgi:hypothetical protein